jgi:hypothetical protein
MPVDKDIKVEILTPPSFKRSGIVKDRREAWSEGAWIGTFNLWIVQDNPKPAIVYQKRGPNIGWAPGKLDVAVAGHYENLETIEEGLREAREELGKDYRFEELTSLGRRLNVGVGADGTFRNTVIDLFMIKDNSPISGYKLQEEEVYAICICPILELIKVHADADYSFKAEGLKFDGSHFEEDVTKESFPYNWDDYHFKMALLASRYLKGKSNLIY